MKPSGVLLTLFGLWLGVQVLLGDALGRLGIAGDAPEPTTPPPGFSIGPDGRPRDYIPPSQDRYHQ